jgi:hypothetical protein
MNDGSFFCFLVVKYYQTFLIIMILLRYCLLDKLSVRDSVYHILKLVRYSILKMDAICMLELLKLNKKSFDIHATALLYYFCLFQLSENFCLISKTYSSTTLKSTISILWVFDALDIGKLSMKSVYLLVEKINMLHIFECLAVLWIR